MNLDRVNRALTYRLDRALLELQRMSDLRWRGPQAIVIKEGVGLLLMRNGRPLEFPLGDLDATAHLFSAGVYDRYFHKFLKSQLRQGDVFVDVGANIGQFALTAASCVGPRGLVVAFEPNPQVREILTDNFFMHRTAGWIQCEVQIRSEAVGDTEQDGTLFVPQAHAGRASVRPSVLRDFHSAELRCVEIKQTALDQVLDCGRRVRLIKIDVEGNELQVMLGARELLHSGLVDFVDLEYVPAHLGSERAHLDDLLREFVSVGCHLALIGVTGKLRPVAPEAVMNATSHLVLDLRGMR